MTLTSNLIRRTLFRFNQNSWKCLRLFRQSINMEDEAGRLDNRLLSRDFLLRTMMFSYELFLVWESCGNLALKHASQCSTGFYFVWDSEYKSPRRPALDSVYIQVGEVLLLGQYILLVKCYLRGEDNLINSQIKKGVYFIILKDKYTRTAIVPKTQNSATHLGPFPSLAALNLKCRESKGAKQ